MNVVEARRKPTLSIRTGSEPEPNRLKLYFESVLKDHIYSNGVALGIYSSLTIA